MRDELLRALSILDEASSKARLTREEHILVEQSVAKLKKEILKDG